MPCSWLYREPRTLPERFCDKPGHPYCAEHQREMDAMEHADQDWVEILATHMAVCEEPKEEQKLCADEPSGTASLEQTRVSSKHGTAFAGADQSHWFSTQD
jgi:hypothetical protein